MRNALVIGLLLNTSLLSAGTLGNTDKLFELSGSALYLQSTTSPAQAPDFQMFSSASTINSHENLPYAWGFKLEASYHYNSTNDYTVNWYNFSDSTTGTSALNTPYTFVIPTIGSTQTTALNLDQAKLDTWNMANIEFGKRIDWGDADTVRFHGGVQYSGIKQETQMFTSSVVNVTTTIIDVPDTALDLHVNSTATFNGFGPRMGVDFTHFFGYSLSGYIKGASAVLAGSTHNSINTSFTDNADAAMNQPMNTVAVNFEGRLGLTYGYPCYQGKIIADGGWLWIPYINLNSFTSMGTDNFAIQGVYFGLKWQGQLS